MLRQFRQVLTLCVSATIMLGIMLSAGGFGDAASASTPRKPTLLEFIRTGAVHALGSASRQLEPRAMFKSVDSAWAQGRTANRYFLYASDTTTAGLGSVKIFPGWIHGPNPPVIGQIDGLDRPAGLAIDKFGTLYVVQADQGAPVLVFPFLSRTPSLQLSTEGIPVSIAVSNDGTVFVGTATTGPPSVLLAEILVYPPGSAFPALHLVDLAGDAVGSVRVDALNAVFFGADFIGYGNSLNEITPWAHRRSIVALGAPQSGLDLDRSGNLVTYIGRPTVQVFSQTGAPLRTINTDGFQSLSLNSNDSALYTAAGTIYKNSYPAGAPLDTITTLSNDNTFGLATYPAAPLPR